MKFLLDTNIVIAGEPTSADFVEETTEVVSALIGLLQESKNDAYIHPKSVSELMGDQDEKRRSTRQALLLKYPKLPAPPNAKTIIADIGGVTTGSNGEVDAHLLAAVANDAVHILVTEDLGIHKWAKRLGYETRVLTASDAIAMLRGLSPEGPLPPPATKRVLCHTIDERMPFFDSFRSDYSDFDNWFSKCKQEHREAFVIPAEDGIAGLAILNEETKDKRGITGRLLKLCSFKVATSSKGNRYGELLLKAVFGYAESEGYDAIFCTCYPKQWQLMALLGKFGFSDAGSERGETVLRKRTTPEKSDYDNLDPLEFHLRFGPTHIKTLGVKLYAVPIYPRWHQALFPELEEQKRLKFDVGQTVYGNSIRKAYLCKSSIRQIEPGSILLFYRTEDASSIRAVGVAEGSIREASAEQVIRYVGPRTVYPASCIEEMAQSADRGVLAILFRQASSLEKIKLVELIDRGVLNAAPQSITQVRSRGEEWIQALLEA